MLFPDNLNTKRKDQWPPGTNRWNVSFPRGFGLEKRERESGGEGERKREKKITISKGCRKAVVQKNSRPFPHAGKTGKPKNQPRRSKKKKKKIFSDTFGSPVFMQRWKGMEKGLLRIKISLLPL